MSKKHVIIFLLAALSAAACARTDGTSYAPSYDSETDCLNGTMIVTQDGRYGLADTSGREIIEPRFDDLYFITDDIGVAFSGDVCSFFDKTGKRIGEAVLDGEETPDGLLGIYTRIRSGQRSGWDDILSRYEEFRRYCQSDGATEAEALTKAEEIREMLRKVEAPMEKDQKVRFESERNAYKR